MSKEEAEKLGPERRMTNQQLWEELLLEWGTGRGDLAATELERRLRKIGFLPALPLKEDGS